jgi:hypothetical protein
MPSSSFYNPSNPTPDTQPSLAEAAQEATAAANAAAAAANEQLAAYTVVNNIWASSVEIDWDEANCHRLTLSGSPTSLSFTGGVDGEKLVLELTQDSSGNRLISLPSSVRYSASIPSVVLSSTPNYMDRLGFMFNEATGKYDLVAVAYGFN